MACQMSPTETFCLKIKFVWLSLQFKFTKRNTELFIKEVYFLANFLKNLIFFPRRGEGLLQHRNRASTQDVVQAARRRSPENLLRPLSPKRRRLVQRARGRRHLGHRLQARRGSSRNENRQS